MRPRFSLRWLLIAFTVLSVIFYVLFIRPTVIAQSYVARAKSGDFSDVENLCHTDTRLADNLQYAWRMDRIDFSTAEKQLHLEPRTWNDLRRFQRRLLFLFRKRGNPGWNMIPVIAGGRELVVDRD